jgi:hypothetical protein
MPHPSPFPVLGLLLHSITPHAPPVPLPHFRPASSFQYSPCPTCSPSPFQARFFILVLPMPNLSPFSVSGPLLHSSTPNAQPVALPLIGPLLHSITPNASTVTLPRFRLASSFHYSQGPNCSPFPFQARFFIPLLPMTHPSQFPVSGSLLHSITLHAPPVPLPCHRPASLFYYSHCPSHPPSLSQARFFIPLLPMPHPSHFSVSGTLLHSITPNAQPVPLPSFRPASSFHYSECPTSPPSRPTSSFHYS